MPSFRTSRRTIRRCGATSSRSRWPGWGRASGRRESSRLCRRWQRQACWRWRRSVCRADRSRARWPRAFSWPRRTSSTPRRSHASTAWRCSPPSAAWRCSSDRRAGESYFLGAIAAMSVLSAAWVARFLDSAPATRLRCALGAALLIQALLLSHAGISAALPWLPDRGPQSLFLGRAPTFEDAQAAQLISTEIRAARGPALSEDPSFAVVAGQPLIGNATHLRNLYQAGLWDPSPMVNDLQAHRYAIVILDAELYPEPVLAAIGQSYFLDRSVQVNGATYRIFLPGTQ